MQKISLVKNTIDNYDIDKLIDWLQKYPKLTKGDLTVEFEKKWSKWLGIKYSVFVNSGSSANLAIIYSLLLSGRLKNDKIVIPSISWVTTVSPIMQLGLNPIICESDKDTLGLDLIHLERIFIEDNPAAVFLVHALGFPNKMKKIIEMCNKYDVILLEDSCESIGSTCNKKKVGNFGLMSSFSFYFGHHISTIEGGMISTNDEEMYNILLSIRSHGWVRDVDKLYQEKWLKNFPVNEFKKMYTFIFPGFNFRSTDLQAFIGIQQLNKIDDICKIRNKNYNLYKKNIHNNILNINIEKDSYISNFAYPIISKKSDKIIKSLIDNNIECRPLISGNIGLQPFWILKYGKSCFKFSDLIHEHGFYVPNNHELKENEILKVCDIININS